MNFTTKSYSALYKLQNCYLPHPDMCKGKLNFLSYPKEEMVKLQRFPNDSLIFVHSQALIDCSADIFVNPYCHIPSNTTIIRHIHTKPLPHIPTILSCTSLPITANQLVLSSDVFLYQNVSILPNCKFIAQGCIIGYGSIVTKSIDEPYSIWAGNPAIRIGSRRQ